MSYCIHSPQLTSAIMERKQPGGRVDRVIPKKSMYDVCLRISKQEAGAIDDLVVKSTQYSISGPKYSS
ncbi:hypothetical protein STEG23_016930 [Scotinomys teguina]